jgi:RNA polymerase sigma-70 factor (ECF subfamily)
VYDEGHPKGDELYVGQRAEVEDARVSAADLYARHASHLFRFCLGQLRNRAEAEDAVQTTFLQAFRALQRGTIPNIERAWLIAIAQNVCRTMQRTSARRRDVETDADPDLIAGADADHPLREEISELERALEHIPANQRRALMLHEWRGLRYREIAGVMGISQTAVEMLAFRARRSLSQALNSGAARARQALDVGGILTALRGLLSSGSGVHALAGAGVAGLALATLGASPAPASQARAEAPARPSEIVRSSVLGHAPRNAVVSPKRARVAAAVNQVRDSGNAADASVGPATSHPHVVGSPQTSSASPRTSSPSQVASAPTLPPVSLPPAVTTTLPVSVPTLPQPPALTVPQLPAVTVSTPTVTLPSP